MNALEGLKVLELGQLIAGPFAGKTLAEFGADVIKVEPAGVGDPLRKWRLLRDNGTSAWWEVQSRNKRSVCLDLRSTEGQEAVRRAGDQRERERVVRQVGIGSDDSATHGAAFQQGRAAGLRLAG